MSDLLPDLALLGLLELDVGPTAHVVEKLSSDLVHGADVHGLRSIGSDEPREEYLQITPQMRGERRDEDARVAIAARRLEEMPNAVQEHHGLPGAGTSADASRAGVALGIRRFMLQRVK